MDNWEVLESLGIDDDLGIFLIGLGIKGWVNHFQGADESVSFHFVWESGINNYTIEMGWVTRMVADKFDFCKLLVLIL